MARRLTALLLALIVLGTGEAAQVPKVTTSRAAATVRT